MSRKAGALHTIEGCLEARRSPRIYTHAVVADYDHASASKYATHWAQYRGADHWDYSAVVAEARPGVPVAHPVEGGRGRTIVLTYNAADIEKAQAFIAAHSDRAAYLAAEIERSVRAACKPPDGALQVCQWSQSERAARAAVGKWAKRSGYRNVRIVPVQREG